jgi:hypothetical protein
MMHGVTRETVAVKTYIHTYIHTYIQNTRSRHIMMHGVTRETVAVKTKEERRRMPVVGLGWKN